MGVGPIANGNGTGGIDLCVPFPVTMRATPTVTFYAPRSGASGNFSFNQSSTNNAVLSSYPGMTAVNGICSATSGNYVEGHYVATAEL